jgi:hypothetical protein
MIDLNWFVTHNNRKKRASEKVKELRQTVPDTFTITTELYGLSTFYRVTVSITLIGTIIMSTSAVERWLWCCLLVVLCGLQGVHADCSMLNYCNGHGTCQNSTSTCACYDGWGSSADVTFYRAPDCSLRTCPTDRAWADIPTGTDTAHAVTECSNRGVCDRTLGTCTCFNGFTGSACQRTACPNDCSGHGVCLSIKQLARMSNALPLGPNTYYEGSEDTITWDEDKSYGCLCDSSWPVGLGAGETQEPEWFGPDCSQRMCI